MDTPSRDDIDLQELAVRIIRFFRNHLIFILIFCAAGIGLGYTAYQTLPRVFESKMVVLSDLLTKTYGERMGLTLNNLVLERNLTDLSSKLNLSSEKVASITSIDVECQLDVKSPQREKVEKDETYFILTVGLTDRSALPDIQTGLLYYMRNNEYVKLRAKQRTELNTALVQRIDRDIRTIDSLTQFLFQKGPRASDLQFDPTDQQELELANSIHLVEGFTAFEKPKDPKLSKLVIIGFLLGLFGAIGLLTLRHLFTLAKN
jgi:uncharacterized membrane protein